MKSNKRKKKKKKKNGASATEMKNIGVKLKFESFKARE
jgi:hypothetical protein